MNRLVIACVAMAMLSGCYVVHHQGQAHPKPASRTVMHPLKAETVPAATAQAVASAQKMETISFSIFSGCCEPIPNEDPKEKAERFAKKSQEYKDLFSTTWGVTWPTGSSFMWCDHSVVRVTNTAENLLKIIKNLSDHMNANPEIELDVQIVEAGPAALAAIAGISGNGHIDAAAEKREKLMKRDDVRLLETFHMTTRNGQECVTKAVTEYIYPTEYAAATNSTTAGDAARAQGAAPILPANFEMREVGTCFQVVPEIKDLGNQIDFMLNVRFTGEPTWKDYSRQANQPLEQPFFPNVTISTQFTGTPDETTMMILGGLSRSGNDSPGKTLLLFLTPHLIHRHKGGIFTPIRLESEPEQGR